METSSAEMLFENFHLKNREFGHGRGGVQETISRQPACKSGFRCHFSETSRGPDYVTAESPGPGTRLWPS